MIDAGFESHVLTAGNQRIHVVSAGSGPLVVLCHGFTGSWYSWRHQLSALAEAGYRAVALDMRGCGRSGKPPAVHDYRITELVADCAGVVAALGEETAVIAGHDWGAPVAWTAAWTRPDVFRAVIGVSLPFAGRGLMALPGSPFGELRPSVAARQMAGAGTLFYQEYFALPGAMEREFEEDVRAWIAGGLYSFSAAPPLPEELLDVDFTTLSEDLLIPVLRGTGLCIPHGARMKERMIVPDELPAWLTRQDIDFLVSELERTGITGGLNCYRALDLDWELLGAHQGHPVEVPALFIGGDRDVMTIWARDARARAREMLPQMREHAILANCGHWIQQEQPAACSAAIIEFLGGL